MPHALPPPVPEAADLLHWYDRHRRSMPWRAKPGHTPDPYHVWLSEIMLQQTTVAAVGPFFRRFLARFPTVSALAGAPIEAVLQEWAGLGYYARARNLHACAQAVAASGGFPRDLPGLRALPGVGPYTAAAIASIAFGIPVVPVDGNVERVAARLFAIDTPIASAKREVAAGAAQLGSDPDAAARPADFTQALFDLGATICTPRNPACAICPWRDRCIGRARGLAEHLPVKAPRKGRPVKHGVHFWLQDANGRVLLRRRPPNGLLGGLLALPGTGWRPAPWAAEEALAHAPQPAEWRRAGEATHGFTHFELHMAVYVGQVDHILVDGDLHPAAALDTAGLPTAMRRCVKVALSIDRNSPAVNPTAP